MTLFKVAITLVGVLAVAGCTTDREPDTIRTGPQVELPYADSPNGKALRDEDGKEIFTTNNVVIDDSQTQSQAQIDQFATGATSIVITAFR